MIVSTVVYNCWINVPSMIAEKAMDKLKEENKELQMNIVQLETEIKNNK